MIHTLLVLLLGIAGAADQNYLPKSSCDQRIEHHYYNICYSEEHRQAIWTHYKATLESINGKQKRTDDFRSDPKVDEDPVGSKDYSGSGFDRGHMVPAGDMKLSKTSMSETFYMSNMSPQNPSLNRGIWGSLENRVRSWVREDGDAYVVTAPVLESGLDRIKSRVSIPEYYYKIIYFPETKIMKAFLIPNKNLKGETFYDYSVPVDEIEELTGFDFFSELPNSLEEELESESYYY